MISRNIILELLKWRNSNDRRPLLLRGARQVGKTTVVSEFSKVYKQYIYINLERKESAILFEEFKSFKSLVESIFFLHGKNILEKDTLLFIDEIQEVPETINLLRYFWEDYPDIHVIAAGSLLETFLTENVTIPVGRVEYLVMRPLSFDEFLSAMGETQALEQLNIVPFNDFVHLKLQSLFQTYILIGGMPEIVKNYAANRNLSGLSKIYDRLFASYINDVEKYARNSTMTQIVRHVVKTMCLEAGNRVKFQNFGNSNYGSREVGEALRVLEKALLLKLIYPITSPLLPVFSDLKKAPRLQILDTGLLNYAANIQKEILLSNDLSSAYNGKIAEHIVGQELMANQTLALSDLNFWTREKKDAQAEIDFIRVFDGTIFPIEVKAGATGTLRSLQSFIDACPHHWAIRLYSGEFSVNSLRTINNKKPYYLLNLPLYAACRIDQYLEWFMKKYPLSNI